MSRKKKKMLARNEMVKMKEIENKKEISNGIEAFNRGMMNTSQLSKTDTIAKNNRYYYIFNNRILLSTLYVEHGIIQTLIDQPVDDAFRGGVNIKSRQLDEDDISKLQKEMEINDVWKKITQTIKWGRLFGGGGLVIMTSQPDDKPFNINRINEFTPIEFYPADLWELNLVDYSNNPSEEVTTDTPYMFYGKPLHESRVLKFKGKEAPSMIRRRFRGWGMTEVERLIRSFNQYLKNNDVIFDLLDEAKVDIYKLENYNTSMLSNQEKAIESQIQMSNMLKSYLNALVMDKEDEYDQKQVTFAGLSDMLSEVRKGIASDLKIPVTKLFGVSSAGFNSGEDDIENYNSMVEGEVRAKAKGIVIETIQIYCQKIFGFVPEDIEIEWKPLRVLNSEQEENVKNAKTNRLLSLFSTGLIDTKTAKEVINNDDLISVDVDIDEDLNEAAVMQDPGASPMGASSIGTSGKKIPD